MKETKLERQMGEKESNMQFTAAILVVLKFHFLCNKFSHQTSLSKDNPVLTEKNTRTTFERSIINRQS